VLKSELFELGLHIFGISKLEVFHQKMLMYLYQNDRSAVKTVFELNDLIHLSDFLRLIV